MVPGSTLRYGSNFSRLTLNPRLSSKHPMEAAASPFPSDETTPPVTNMNFLSIDCGSQHCLEFFQIGRRIDPPRCAFHLYHANTETMLERTQLLQSLRDFQRCSLESGELLQKMHPVYIQAEVEKSGPT